MSDQAGFNMFSTAIKQMAFYPTQEIIKQTCIVDAGMSEEQGGLFSSMLAGMVLGFLAAPINVIKVPLQSGVNADFTVRRIIRDVHGLYGFSGFYRGGLGIVLRDTVMSCFSVTANWCLAQECVGCRCGRWPTSRSLDS